MGDIAVSVEIDAPVDRVWRALEPIETHSDWMADAESIEFLTNQRRGVGTEFIAHTRIGPIRLADKMVITSWEPGQRMGVRHEGLVSGSGDLLLEAIDLGRRTRLRWEESLSFPWYFGGRIGEVVGGRAVLGPIWRRNLQRLARLIDDDTP